MRIVSFVMRVLLVLSWGFFGFLINVWLVLSYWACWFCNGGLCWFCHGFFCWFCHLGLCWFFHEDSLFFMRVVGFVIGVVGFVIIQLMHSFEFNIRICQPENSDVHRGEAEVNITFEG